MQYCFQRSRKKKSFLQNDLFVNSVETCTILFGTGVDRLQAPSKIHSLILYLCISVFVNVS